MNTKEHLDFCMSVRQAGEEVYFEPSSVVTYVPGPPLQLMDVHFYMLRWSDAWDLASLNHLRQKWDLAEDKYFKKRYAGLGGRRHELLVNPLVDRLTFGRGSTRLRKLLIAIERKLNHALYNRYINKHPEAPQPIELTTVRQTLQRTFQVSQ